MLKNFFSNILFYIMETQIPDIELNNGITIPQIGLGAAIFPPERDGKLRIEEFKVWI